MKNILRVYINDLKAIIKNPAALVIIIGLIILPSMYAWFNIAALVDPYGNAKDLPIGVISLDQGTKINQETINVGQEVIDDLKTNKELAWQFPATEDEMMDKVNTGEYYAALVIPVDFSSNLQDAIDTYQSPKITYYVNEKVNAIAPKMTEAGAEGVTSSINSSINQVVTEALVDYSNELDDQVQENTDDYNLALDSLNNIINQFGTINSTFEKYDQITNDVDYGIEQIAQFNSVVESDVNNLDYSRIYQALDDASSELDDDTVIEDVRNQVTAIEDFTTNFAIDVDTSDYQYTDDQITDFIYNQWPNYQNQIVNSRDKLVEVGVDYQSIAEYLNKDGNKASEFMASPVDIETETLYPVTNYGSASAPFYTTLCLWVGSLLMASLLSFESSLKVSKYNEYFGKLLLFMTIGILQAVIVTIGDVTILDITISSPWLLLLFDLIIITVFSTIVYTLVYVFGNIGKALGIIILVLSISGGGGNFPIEVSGPFFNMIYPYLPFTYGVKLLREAGAGVYLPTVIECVRNLVVMYGLTLGFGLVGTKYLKVYFDRFDKRSRESKIIH